MISTVEVDGHGTAERAKLAEDWTSYVSQGRFHHTKWKRVYRMYIKLSAIN